MELVLNDGDLLTEILLRLPAKSLIKFKSVSKEWLSLISSDGFCHRHTLRRPKLQHSLILQMVDLEFVYLNLTVDGENTIVPYTLGVPGHHQIVQECNGLLLLLRQPRKYSHYTYNPITYEPQTNLLNSYSVYNPTTRKSRMISLNSSDDYPCIAAVNLAFDPLKSPYYKVVCVRFAEESKAHDPYDGKGLIHRVEVYDSESHTWEVAPGPFTTISRISHGVHCNGAIYWWMCCNGGAFSCFDIARNEMRTLLAPQNVYSEPHDSSPYYQESDGRLYHFDMLETERGLASVALWELKGNDDDGGGRDDSQWLFKYLDVISTNGTDEPVRLMGGSDSERCSLLSHRDRKIIAYNFLDKSYEELLDLTRQPYHLPYYPRMKGFQFGEVLALV